MAAASLPEEAGEVSMKLELGTLQMTIEVKNGELQHNTPRLDVLQNNLEELAAHVPDGTYKWVLVLDVDKAEKC